MMRTRIGLIALLGSLVLVGSVALTRSTGLTARFPGLDRVESAAEAAREGGRETVLLVAGKPVTAAELAEMEHWVAANLTWMREVGTSGAVTAEQRAFLERQAGLIERHGVPTVALASLIVDRAVAAAAEREGLWPDERTVRERVARDREVAATSDDPRLKAYLAAFGEETFWDEHYPRVIALEIAEERLYEARTKGEPDAARRQALWLTEERALALGAPIEVVVPERLPASIDAALQYLAEYYDLQLSGSGSIRPSG